MLRPEQMSKVSVTGTKSVVRDVIEVAHEQNVLHLTDYEGGIEGFDTGAPLSGAESASDRLVTVRSLISILDVTEEDAGPSRIVTEDALDEEFERVRDEVNELDERRDGVEDELDDVEEDIDAVAPFADLGIDLDLLWGYDTVEVVVGEGDEDAVRQALADADGVAEYETFAGDDIVAAFAYPADDATDPLDEAFVGVEFARIEVPEAEGSPEEYVAELEHERQTLQSKLDSVENELETLRLEHAGFLLAVEEKLDIEVQKAEAPLSFATTEHAFVAEGWVPTQDYDAFHAALVDAVDDRVEVEELERAEYEEDREVTGATMAMAERELAEEEREETAVEADAEDAEAEEAEAVADGGHASGEVDQPPVVQDNPGPIKPFEMLVQTINRPNYYDLDPTVVLFLTFPVFYGFMIGDVGYGLLYTAIGYWIYTSFDSDAISALGGIAIISGVATMIFGFLYGEVFGFHLISEYVWNGHPPLHKGLQPAHVEWAQLWLVVSVLVALAHLTTGYVFDFVKQLSHGIEDAVLESGALIVVMVGIWLWVFSRPQGVKPAFLYQVFAGHPVPLGFTGFPPVVGYVGIAMIPIGIVAEYFGGGAIEAYEGFMNALTHVLSYTRLAAVMLAKGGMAFVVNLLFFGAYSVPAEEGRLAYHFMIGTTAEQVLHHHPEATIMFGGLVHGGVAAVLAGLLILVVGHVLVLALGVTSAGLQAVRLEYVEFFGKFYEGGGEKYEPFGHDRSFTTQD